MGRGGGCEIDGYLLGLGGNGEKIREIPKSEGKARTRRTRLKGKAQTHNKSRKTPLQVRFTRPS